MNAKDTRNKEHWRCKSLGSASVALEIKVKETASEFCHNTIIRIYKKMVK